MRPIYFLIFCILCYKLKGLTKEGRRRIVCAAVFGVLFSMGLVLGYLFEELHMLLETKPIAVVALYVIIFFFPSAGLYEILCEAFERLTDCRIKHNENLPLEKRASGNLKRKLHELSQRFKDMSLRRFTIITFVVLFLAWFPYWLAFYPCMYGYDAMIQTHYCIEQSMWTNQQPLLHTMILEVFWNISKLFGGGISGGMALYALCQLGAVAGAATYALSWLHAKHTRGIVWMVLWFALFPVHPMLAISVTKDTLFGAAVLVLVVYFFKVIDRTKKPESQDNQDDVTQGAASYGNISRARLAETIFMLLLAVFAILMRNNAVYAIAAAALISIFIMRGKERKAYVAFIAAALVLTFAGKSIMMAETGASESPVTESLGVPLQQMARVANLAGLEEVSDYISETAAANYRETIVDPVRWETDAELFDDMGAFVKKWVSVGLKYPKIYLGALIANTAGYWNIDDTTVAARYYLQTQNINYNDDICRVELQSKLPQLYRLMDRMFGTTNNYTNSLTLSFFCSVGVYTWLMIYYIIRMIELRRYRELLPILPIAMYFLTLLLGPCVLARYAYVMMAAAPVMIARLQTANDKKNNKSRS